MEFIEICFNVIIFLFVIGLGLIPWYCFFLLLDEYDKNEITYFLLFMVGLVIGLEVLGVVTIVLKLMGGG